MVHPSLQHSEENAAHNSLHHPVHRISVAHSLSRFLARVLSRFPQSPLLAATYISLANLATKNRIALNEANKVQEGLKFLFGDNIDDDLSSVDVSDNNYSYVKNYYVSQKTIIISVMLFKLAVAICMGKLLC